jgi:hypothetical protein
MSHPTIVRDGAGHRWNVLKDFNEVCWLAAPLFGRNRTARLLRKAGCVDVRS